jgi:hypothetical protein
MQLDSTPLLWYCGATWQHTTLVVLWFKWTARHCCSFVLQFNCTPLLRYCDSNEQHATAVVLRFKWTARHFCGIVVQFDSTPLLLYCGPSETKCTSVVAFCQEMDCLLTSRQTNGTATPPGEVDSVRCRLRTDNVNTAPLLGRGCKLAKATPTLSSSLSFYLFEFSPSKLINSIRPSHSWDRN